MKKMIKYTLGLVLLLIITLNGLTTHAQGDFGDFPYEGTYATTEDYVIKSFTFDHEARTISITFQSSEKGIDRMNKLINLGNNNNLLLSAVIDPSITSQQIEDTRSAWNFTEYSLSDIYLETAEKVEPWMTDYDIQQLLSKRISGIHTFSHNDMMITHPTIQKSQDLWIVNFFNIDRIFRFEADEDIDTLVDDFGITYELVKEGE